MGENDERLATPVEIRGSVPADVSLKRTATTPTEDQSLWVAIRNRTQAIGFNRYHSFINRVLCEEATDDDPSTGYRREFASMHGGYGEPSALAQRTSLSDARRPTIHGVDAYRLLKLATEAFLIFECGVYVQERRDRPAPPPIDEQEERRRLGHFFDFDEDNEDDHIRRVTSHLESYLNTGDHRTPPYFNRIVNQIVSLDQSRRREDTPYCEAILQHRLTSPSLLELIWSYWHEEGMLAQTMNAIALRFQNKRSGGRDPLANLELDPLRPLNNIIWGYVQDEYNRLSVPRRAYEYDHHYGFSLVGRAVPSLQSADSRTKFIGAFHNLLYRTAMFYREDDDTTIVADAFAMLNALREVHIILAEGAHNQFGDLPWTARAEMLMMQWILARPETKEFLRGRYMVPYQESWMGAVDDMKRLQGWGDVTITHFHELAIYGEQVLLAVRYGDWIDINDQEYARNWARYWRPEIQRYMHAYNAVTGVDLSTDIVDTRRAEDRYAQPSLHLQKRLEAPHSRGALPAPSTAGEVMTYDGRDYVALPPAPRSRASRRRRRG